MIPTFANAALLAGLGAIAAPILIHLLLRRRSQRLKFSTIQFFVRKDEQAVRRRKLRNLLLLAMRILVFALLVLAFARPYFQAATGALPRTRQQVVLLLDGSASMQASGLAGLQWRRAKEYAEAVLGRLQPDDRAALVTSAAGFESSTGFLPPSALSSQLAKLQPASGSWELAEALQDALKLLAAGDPAHDSSVHIVSDLQKNGCRNLGTVSLPNNVPVHVFDSGDRFIPNSAITDLSSEARTGGAVRGFVSSFSDEDSEAALKLLIDREQVASRSISLIPGASSNISFKIPKLSSGWHSLELEWDSDDSFPSDNRRFMALCVPDPIRCLLIEAQEQASPVKQETYFVSTALDPVIGTNSFATPRFSVETTAITALGGKLRPELGVGVLPGIQQLPPGLVQQLRAFVENGGGLIFFLGSNTSPNLYNSELRALMPAALGRRETVGASSPWRIAQFDKSSPVFEIFRNSGSGNLLLPGFTERYVLAPLPGGAVLAEFDDETPVVMVKSIGKGRVILVNTSSDTSWTDWQKHKTFVPWIHSTAAFLAARNVPAAGTESLAFDAGSDVDLALASPNALVTLHQPDGAEEELKTDSDGFLRDVNLKLPGIYTVKGLDGSELRRIAANLPSSESDLSFLSPLDVKQQLVRRDPAAGPIQESGPAGSTAGRNELWRPLLAGALLLLVVEPLLANRTAA